MLLTHITVHLGGGAGKAIVGMAEAKFPDVTQQIFMLEAPEKMQYVEEAESRGISVIMNRSEVVLRNVLETSDVIVLNWWGHPAMVDFLIHFPKIPCRMILWSHVNGCHYPYLPVSFVKLFSKRFFTSDYSIENPYWPEEESRAIKQNSTVVYGMGDFTPGSYNSEKLLNKKADDTFVIGYVGTLNYSKLHPEFVSYCEAVVRAIPNVKFVLAGEPDERLRKDIEESSIADYFDCVGYIRDVATQYRSFDAFGYLLQKESFATTENSLLEAMAYGLPIVVLDHPVERHIIYQGVNGFIVSGKKEYAETMKKLSENQELRMEAGNKAREYAIRQYSKEENEHRFYQGIKTVFLEEKENVDFTMLPPENKPEEWFFYLAGESGQTFRNCLEQENDKNKEEARACQQIFKGESKGSVQQFAKYFPECEKFKKLLEILGEQL